MVVDGRAGGGGVTLCCWEAESFVGICLLSCLIALCAVEGACGLSASCSAIMLCVCVVFHCGLCRSAVDWWGM